MGRYRVLHDQGELAFQRLRDAVVKARTMGGRVIRAADGAVFQDRSCVWIITDAAGQQWVEVGLVVR